MFEQHAQNIELFTTRLSDLQKALNTADAETKIAELEAVMAGSGFWDVPEKAQETVQQMKLLNIMLQWLTR